MSDHQVRHQTPNTSSRTTWFLDSTEVDDQQMRAIVALGPNAIPMFFFLWDACAETGWGWTGSYHGFWQAFKEWVGWAPGRNEVPKLLKQMEDIGVVSIEQVSERIVHIKITPGVQ